MTLGRFAQGKGVVYVGTMVEGKVYAVEIDQGRAVRVHTLATGLELPAGVAWREGALYVSALTRILRFDAIDDHLGDAPAPKVALDGLPGETHHGAKYIAFGPDGWLYIAVGSPCNVCQPDAAHGIIQRVRLEHGAAAGKPEVVAQGVRNSVGFDWSPQDRALWFTDNGRDMLGDDLPADELNRVAQAGANFGFPYCHQGDLPDPQYGSQRRCAEFVPPAAGLGAHVASLGMRFYTGTQFPAAYRGDVFIAEHGSWNRSRKVGYRVVRVVVDGDNRALRQQPFVQGFLQVDAAGRETVLGRPADVLVLPDGSLLVSDDLGGAIYRVSHAP
jgi:glucose/arabinose dehydrogenase